MDQQRYFFYKYIIKSGFLCQLYPHLGTCTTWRKWYDNRTVVSTRILTVATFAIIVATKVLLSPLLSSFEWYTVYLPLEIQFWTTVCRHIQISSCHMWRMATKLDNTVIDRAEYLIYWHGVGFIANVLKKQLISHFQKWTDDALERPA